MNDLAKSMPLARQLGISATHASAEKVIGSMVVSADLCTVGDSVHGGALMAFADSIAAIGAYLNLPEGASGTTTIESKTNFIGRATIDDQLTAVATPLSTGRRVSVWETKITRNDGSLVAVVTQTQLVL